jgi:hypothetical protein
MIKLLLSLFKPKSPCHNAPMITEVEYNYWGEGEVYKCPECEKKYV